MQSLEITKESTKASDGSPGPVDSLKATEDVEIATAARDEDIKNSKEPAEGRIRSVSYFALFRYADRWDIFAMIAGTLGAIANGAGMPVFAILLGNIMNDFGDLQNDPSALTSKINSTVPVFIYLGLGAAVGAYCQGFFWSTTSMRQVNRIRSVYLRHVLHQDIGYFDTTGTSGYLLQGLNEDCITIQSAIGEKVAMFLFFMSTAVTGIIIALVRGWDMALVILSLLPVLGAAGFALSVVISRMTNSMNKAYADAGSLAQQALGNVRTVYAFNGEQRTLSDYDAALDVPMRVGIRQGFLAGATLGMVNGIAFMGYALAMWYGAKRVTEGAYDGARVLTVLFSALIGGFSLGQAAPNVQYFQQGRASAGRLYSILKRQPLINIEGGGEQPKDVSGTVEFTNVTFAYPSREDKPVFREFSLTVPAGKTVALVGESGSGKSTVIQLIERFYDPQSGAVLLDGMNLKHLDLRWLRSQVGLVSQEPTLFATTIKENILFGKPGSTDEEVEAAARAANAANFINGLPNGYDTHVGEKGVQMSGGQKQRIAIARAMLKNPKVLLLDEATSALDAESEAVVQEALDKLMVGRTTIVVAHRLSTIIHADIIAVVKGGQVIEQGNHQSLLEQGGAYATLVQMQQATGGDLVASPSSASLQCALTEKEDTEVQKTVNRKSLESPRDSEGGSKDDGHGKDERNLTENIGEWTGNAKAVGVAAPILVPGRAARGWKQMLSLRRAPKKTDGHSADAATSKKGKKQKEEDQPKVNASFARLAALNKPELPAAVGGLLGAGAMGLLFPIFAVTLSSLIALFYKPVDEIPSGARTWSLVFVGMGVGSLIAASLQSFCFNFMGQRLAKRVRVLMMQALLRQEVGWYDDDRNSSGVLSSKLATDAAAVRGQFGDTMGLLAQNLVTVLAAYIISGISSWRMMLVVTAMVPLMVFSAIVQTKLMLNASNEEEESFAVASATAAEAFSSVRTVAAFGMEGQVSSLYERSLKLPTQKSRKRAHFGGIGFAFSQFVLFGVYSLAFWYMGLEISRDNSSFENSMKAFFAIFLAAFGLAQAQAYFPDVAKGGAAVRRVFGIIDRKPSIDASDPGGIRPMETVGAIELQDVTFAYPQRPDAPVFSKFSLTVPAGKTVALVGESGSGKSTVVSLIERFYDPQQGAVLIDGINIKTLNLQWLRSQIGLVSQEPVLFNMTVADNIRYGRPQASMEDVVAAAKAANAHGFIEALPEGYHTRLGEGSIQLSGGQKQRVAIARAVVKDPKVLLLDEATSALDAESEHIVQEALDRLMVGRTTVVIAHRLSTVRDADAIAVVYKGRIVEQGTHAELLEKGGSYARLVAHQMQRSG